MREGCFATKYSICKYILSKINGMEWNFFFFYLLTACKGGKKGSSLWGDIGRIFCLFAENLGWKYWVVLLSFGLDWIGLGLD